MKKVLISIIVCLCFLLSAGVAIYMYQIYSVGSFCLDEDGYLKYMISHYDEFSSGEIVLGEIKGEDDAREKALNILNEKYNDCFEDYKPYRLYYDEKNDLWYMVGYVPPIPNLRSRVPYIVFQGSDGKVLVMAR